MRGFTLLELLLALMILGVLGVGTAGLLYQVTEARERVNLELWGADRLQWFFGRLEADLATYAPTRPVRKTDDTTEPALALSETGLAFTRLGWQKPEYTETDRSLLQRVRYRVVPWKSGSCTPIRRGYPGGSDSDQTGDLSCVIREYTQHLEPLSVNEPVQQAVLGPVDEFRFRVTAQFVARYAQGQGEWRDTWPPAPDSSAADAGKGVQAVSVVLSGPGVAPVELMWQVPLAPSGDSNSGDRP